MLSCCPQPPSPHACPQGGGSFQPPRGRAGSSSSSSDTERAVVRFSSAEEAHRAVRTRQGTFCGTQPVRLRVLL